MHAVRPAAVKSGKGPAAQAPAESPPETPHDPETGEVQGDPEPQEGDMF